MTAPINFPPVTMPIPTGASDVVQDRLEVFRRDHCSDINPADMAFMIKEGDTLIGQLNEAAKNEATWLQLLTSLKGKKHAAVYFMWALTKRMASQGKGPLGDLHTAGATRIGQGEPLNDKRIEQFFLACGGATFARDPKNPQELVSVGGDVYQRISSHMKEGLKRSGFKQKGFDLRDLDPVDGHQVKLPAGKRTLLLARQPDHTFYMKMEEHGVPCWSTNENFREWLGHACDYLDTRKKTGPFSSLAPLVARLIKWIWGLPGSTGVKEVGSLPERKEHVTQQIISIFKKFLEDHKVDLPGEEKKEVKKRGLSAMEDVIQDQRLKAELQKEFQDAGVRGSVPEGYKGEIQGNEVLLPNLSLETPRQ